MNSQPRKGISIMQIVTQAELSNKMPSYQDKVRDLYDLGDQLLIISTDRISA